MSRTRLIAFSKRHADFLACLALTWLVGRALLPGVLLAGGAAIVLVVAIVAIGVGAPLAARRRLVLAPTPVRAAWTRTLVPALTGAVLAQSLTDLGMTVTGFNPWVAGVILLGWILTTLRAPAAGVRLAPVVAMGLVLLSLGVAVAQAAQPVARTPWTALAPGWGTVSAWLPAAVLIGLLGSGAGTELWSTGTRARAGHPWGGAGWSVLLVMALAGVLALAHESSVSPLDPIPALFGAGWAAPLLIAALSLVTLHLLVPAAWAPQALAEAVTWGGALAWAGPDARAWLWQLAVPVALAAALADDARRLSGAARSLAVAGAALATLALLAGLPPVPDAVGASLGAALSVSALVWVGGARAVTAKGAA